MSTKNEPKASRMRAGHTQREAAAQLGVALRTWENWESGTNAMPEQMLRLYRHLAGIERIPYRAAS